MPKTNVKPEKEFHAEVIVEIVNTAINAMESLGLSQEEALNGILSQVAVQVDAKAMAHANQLNQQLHEIYKSLNN